MKALVVPTINAAELRLSPEAVLAKDQALHGAADILAVSDADSQQIAVAQLGILAGFLKKLEDSRTAVKRPFLDFCKEIDALARTTAQDVERQVARIKALVTGFQREEARKAEELREQEERKRRLSESFAAKKQQRLEDAGRTEEAAEVAQGQVVARAQQSAPVAAPPKAAGMSVSAPWLYEVLDIAAVHRARPDLCRVEISTSAANQAVRAGLRECPGLRIYQDVKVAVRAT